LSNLIKLLPDHIANQIAAGEVIQRPASVVKELIENAIDSGATQVEVYIKDAGKTLIQVIDNGCGMSETDARMAFARHATSKLSTAEDLFALKTKGFRGEALASIAAIAHVELKTRLTNEESGISIEIEGSEFVSSSYVTCKVGSSFAVKNLFFNVPARRNFLKSDAVEFKHIEDEFLRIALPHSNIKLTLIHNDQVVYHLEQANLRKRIIDIFGRIYNDKIVPIEEETDIVKIEGFIGKPEFAKKSRGEQYFFVNDRFFRDNYFNHALTQAYDNLLASKTFPSYFVFFTIKPNAIDVNVHPTKTEIKFESDKEIYAILKSSVRLALGKFNISPTIDFEQEKSFDLPWEMNNSPVVAPSIKVDTSYNPFSSSSSSSKSNSNGNSDAIRQSGFGNSAASQTDWKNFYNLDKIEEEKSSQQEIDIEEEIHVKKHLLFYKNYLITSVKNGLLLIHSKRALERICYDEIMATFILNPINSQQLLFPLSLEMSKTDIELWEENKQTIQRLGFEWSVTENSLDFNGTPAYLNETQTQNCLEHIHQKLTINQLDKGEMAHEFALSIAKSYALQKENINQEAGNQLIENLFQCSEHQFAPSGKLILKTISQEQLFNEF
jgi:DNA mismatch repair protein MutL